MNNIMKRNVSILAAVLLSASVMIGGTLAYFYDQQEVINPFSTAGSSEDTGVDVEITEPNYDPDSSQDMYPGSTITKDPTVTNLRGESYARFVVRLVEKGTTTPITNVDRANKIMQTLFFDMKFAASNGSVLETTKGYSQAELAALINAVGSNLKTPVNPEFILDDSRSSVGVYYYNYSGTLTKDMAKKLFTHVAIPTDWTQTDLALVGDFDLRVQGQAIQKANIADADTAFDALDDELTAIPTP